MSIPPRDITWCHVSSSKCIAGWHLVLWPDSAGACSDDSQWCLGGPAVRVWLGRGGCPQCFTSENLTFYSCACVSNMFNVAKVCVNIISLVIFGDKQWQWSVSCLHIWWGINCIHWATSNSSSSSNGSSCVYYIRFSLQLSTWILQSISNCYTVCLSVTQYVCLLQSVSVCYRVCLSVCYRVVYREWRPDVVRSLECSFSLPTCSSRYSISSTLLDSSLSLTPC